MYAALFLVVLIGGYLLSCVVWPLKPCPVCKGNGKRRAPLGVTWRKCSRCKGTGEVRRIGRRVLGR